MRARKNRLLVIDASVVQSAGETQHPESSACRETLLAVLRICHRVVLTEAIRDEWKRHMSRFSRKWQLSMTARKKILHDEDPAEVNVDTAGLLDADRDTIEKDLCLVNAALAADRIIVTRDDTLKQALAKTREGARLLRTIKWLNPVTDRAAAIENL